MTSTRMTMLLWSAALALVAAAGNARGADAPRMSVEELNSRLGEPGLVIVDTRSTGDWGTSAEQIKGATRQDPGAVAAWAEEFKRDQTIVAYCA